VLLYAPYSSPNIIQVIMSGIMRWPRQVARMGDKKRCIQGFGEETCGKRVHLADLGVDGRIIL